MAISHCAGFEALLDRLLSELRFQLAMKHRADMEGREKSIDSETPARDLPDFRVETLHSMVEPTEMDTTRTDTFQISETLSISPSTTEPSWPVKTKPKPTFKISNSSTSNAVQDAERGNPISAKVSGTSAGVEGLRRSPSENTNQSTNPQIDPHMSVQKSKTFQESTFAGHVLAILRPSTPDATSRVIWDVVMCAVLLLLIVIETTSVAIPECQEGAFADFWGIFLLVSFTVDILINFNTALVAIVGRKIIFIYDRWQIAKAYCKGWFLIDLFATFPYDMVLSGVVSASNARLFKAGKILRMARLVKGFVKIAKLMQQWGEVQDRIQEQFLEHLVGGKGYEIDKAAKYLWRAWCLCFCLLIEAHLFACFLLVLTRNSESMSWRTSGINIHEVEPFARYVAAIRDVIYILATGVIDEDVRLHNILLALLVVWFYIQLTIVISIFVGIKSDPGLSDEDFSVKCSKLRRYLRRHQVVKRVRDEVDSHLSKVGKYIGMNLDSLLDELPGTIRQSVSAGLYYPFYERMSFLLLDNTSEAFEYDICAAIQTLFYRPYDQVVSKGCALHGLHYLSEGYAVIARTSSKEAHGEADWIPGDYLYLEALFAPRPLCESIGDVTAIEPCEVWFLARATFDRLVEETYPLVRQRVEKIRAKIHFSEESHSWVLEVTNAATGVASIGIGSHSLENVQYFGLNYLVENGRHSMLNLEWDDQDEDRLKRGRTGSLVVARRMLPSGKRFHYFLSHRKHHSKLGNRPELIAQSLHDALDTNGFTGFFDVDNLEEISRPALEEAVRESCAMIVIINDETAASEWCRLEWECAAANEIPVKCVVDAQHSNKADVLHSIRDVNPALLQYQWSEYLDRYRKSVAKDLVDWLRTTVPSSRTRSSNNDEGAATKQNSVESRRLVALNSLDSQYSAKSNNRVGIVLSEEEQSVLFTVPNKGTEFINV